MPGDLGVRLLIEADNRATQELEKVPADVKRLQDQMAGLNKEAEKTVRTYDSVLAEFRKSAGIVNTDLVPALKKAEEAHVSMSSAMGIAVSLASGLGTAIGHLASTMVSQYLDSLKKTREELEAWNRAMQGSDVNALTAAIKTQADEVRKLAVSYIAAANARALLGSGARFQEFPDISGGTAADVGRPEAALDAAMAKLARGQGYLQYQKDTFGIEQAEGPGVVDENNRQLGIRMDNIKRANAAAAAAAKRAQEAEAKTLERIRRGRFGTDYGGDESLAYSTKPLAQIVQEQEDSPVVLAYKRALSAQAYETQKGQLGGEEELAFKPGTDAGVNRLIRNEVQAMRTLAEEQKKMDDKLKAEFERTDMFAGFIKGFDDVAKAAESSGQIMQDFAHSTAATMQRAFSDVFFNVITGQFKNLADVGKQFGLAMARNLSDALATSATAPILRGLAGLGGFFPDSGMSLLNIAPGAQQQVSSLQRAGYSLGGEGVYGPSTGVRGGGGLYSGLYASAGGAGDTLPAASYAPPGGAGFDVGSLGGLGVGLAGIGLGIAASQYSGMTAGAFGAAAIGLSLGSSLGGLAASAGLFGAGVSAASAGTGVGLGVAILAIGAYIAIAGATAPTNDRPNTGWRLIELSKALDADGARVNASRSFLELADAIRGAMHQAYGGDRTGYSSRQTTSFTRGQGGTSAAYAQGRGASMASAGYAIWINGQQVILPGGSYAATMTLADFAVYLETKTDSFTARLQLGLDERTLRDINSNFEQVVKDQAERIRTFNTLPISFSETAPGLQRTTILAAGALENTAGIRGQALSVDRQLGLRLGLTDEQIDSFLRRLSDRNTQTDRFPDLPRDVRLIL